MRTLMITFVLILIATVAHAQDLSFYIIYPDGEGDTNAAKPYLANLFDYLKESIDVSVSGLYLNDISEAELALQENKVQLAIVSPEFYEKFHKKFEFQQVLKTIPIYSNGPYERYYIMAHNDTDVLDLMNQQINVNLFSSQVYADDFLNEKVFIGNDEIKKIPWRLQQSEDIVEAIKKISSGTNNTFVLLSGYEFSVINKMRKTGSEFANLKLIYTSKELPSSALVQTGKIDAATLEKIKTALMQMPASLKGNLILTKLRLKGFAQL